MLLVSIAPRFMIAVKLSFDGVNGNSHIFDGGGPFYWVTTNFAQIELVLIYDQGWPRLQWRSGKAKANDEVEY